MDLKLRFDLPPSGHLIGIRDPMLVMGSCFAEHIGERLQQHKFNVLSNPGGILFNPISMVQALHDYAAGRTIREDELFAHDSVWHSWQHHGSLGHPDRAEALRMVNAAVEAGAKMLASCSHILLSFGSAFVYELKDSGEIVANCHKVPQERFHKRLLSVKEIIAAFEQLLTLPVFAGKHIMLTVSPVRYVRDGLVENNHSKAVLIRAVHELIAQHAKMDYFPAYEIVIDELRDYRFYEADLVHPNKLAIEYVWERFCESRMDEETKVVVQKVKEVRSAFTHRPLHPGSAQHAQFLSAYSGKVQALKSAYPFLDLEEELAYFGNTH